MSTMVTELYRALKRSGLDDASAEEAASSVMGTEYLGRFATKEDLADLKADLIRWTAGLLIGVTALFAGIVKLLLP